MSRIILKGPLSGASKSKEGSAIALSSAISGFWPSSSLTKFSSYIGHFRVCALLAVIKINEFLLINFSWSNLVWLKTSIGATIALFSFPSRRTGMPKRKSARARIKIS